MIQLIRNIWGYHTSPVVGRVYLREVGTIDYSWELHVRSYWWDGWRIYASGVNESPLEFSILRCCSAIERYYNLYPKPPGEVEFLVEAVSQNLEQKGFCNFEFTRRRAFCRLREWIDGYLLRISDLVAVINAAPIEDHQSPRELDTVNRPQGGGDKSATQKKETQNG